MSRKHEKISIWIVTAPAGGRDCLWSLCGIRQAWWKIWICIRQTLMDASCLMGLSKNSSQSPVLRGSPYKEEILQQNVTGLLYMTLRKLRSQGMWSLQVSKTMLRGNVVFRSEAIKGKEVTCHYNMVKRFDLKFCLTFCVKEQIVEGKGDGLFHGEVFRERVNRVRTKS